MGIIRGGLLVVISVLLFISFLAGNLFLTMDKSLEYDNVKAEILPVVRDIADEEMDITNVIEDNMETMEDYCLNNSDYVFEESDYTFEVSCESVSKGSEAVVDEGTENLLEDIYYNDYDCGFISCFEEMEYPFFLVSEKFKNKFNNWFYVSLLISLALIVLVFILVESKSNFFIISGSLLIISALPFMKINWFLSSKDNIISNFLIVFFSNSYSIFLSGLILGIVLLILGVISKFFGIGFKIHEFFSKFKKSDGKGQGKKIVNTQVVPQKVNVVKNK